VIGVVHVVRVGHHQASEVDKAFARLEDRPLALQQQQMTLARSAHLRFASRSILAISASADLPVVTEPFGRPTGWLCLVTYSGIFQPVLPVDGLVTLRGGEATTGFCGVSPVGEVWCEVSSFVGDFGGFAIAVSWVLVFRVS
jgi:hypothetical protein